MTKFCIIGDCDEAEVSHRRSFTFCEAANRKGAICHTEVKILETGVVPTKLIYS